MSKPLNPSKTLKPNYSPSKAKGSNVLELDIKGRAPSVLTYGNNAPQGDHVTAHRLVEEGLFRKVSRLTVDEVEALFDIGNRTSLRERRSALYDYVSAIGVLDPTRKDSLYLALDGVLLSYNKERHRKTDIKQKITEFHDDQSLVGSSYEGALKSQEARFRENGERVRGVFRDISALLLTFYNKIPHTAYHYIDGFEEDAGDIKVARTRIDEVFKWMKDQPQGNPIPSIALATKRPQIAEVMNSLIHYPEITDPAKLAAHTAENFTKKGKTNQPRNNSKDTLIMLLSRHVHIFFSVYPELKNAFNQNGELVDDFIDKFIGKGTAQPNWPSFTSNAEIQSIKDGVKAGVIALEEAVAANHYTQWKAAKEADGYDINSSDDEDIPTKPRAKAVPVKAKKLVHVKTEQQEEDVEEMKKELEELRALKAIILKNRDIIPDGVMEEVDDVLSTSHTKKPVKVTKSKGDGGASL